MPLRLPRFQQMAPLVDEMGRPGQAFHIWWDTFAMNIETAFDAAEQNTADLADVVADLSQVVTDLAAVVADVQAAQATADQAIADAADAAADALAAANDAADAAADALDAIADAAAAQSTANTVKRDDGIASSWISPGEILEATDAGADATITIDAHTRKYNDTLSVSVNGGSLTGLAYTTRYFIYYDQTSRAGGAVTYVATTNPNTALPGAAAGRHYCGDVVTPGAGGGATSGGSDPASGGGGLDRTDIP